MRLSYLLPWPDQLSAEKEFSFRLESALKDLGHELVIVREIDFDNTEIAERKNIYGEILLLPHFTISPKEGIVNIQLLWNSPKTVFEFRYGMTNVGASDYLLSGGSVAVDRFFHELTGKKILGELHPSVPNLEFKNQAEHGCKMFYSGINWERITGNPSRHGELLKKLDRANLIDIYGPKKLRGINVWEGFGNYKGEIEMDGKKLVEVANTYGVTLALLNEQHLKWGLPSIRLAEAFRAKNVVLTSEYPLLDFLGDSVFRIPSDMTLEEQKYFIGEKLNWIWNNPKEASEMAELSSKLWFEKNNLEMQLESLIKNYSSIVHVKQDHKNEVRIKILDPHSPNYAQDLHLSLLSEDYELVVHSKQTRDWAQKYFTKKEDMENYSYFITMANLSHGKMTMVHPGLESYSLIGPSFVVAETVIYNFQKLKEIVFQIPFDLAGSVFSHVFLLEKSQGRFIPEITCKVPITYRFYIPISINQPHQIIGFGEIFGLSYSPVLNASRSQFGKTMKLRITKVLPPSIKDFLRPFWLKIQRL